MSQKHLSGKILAAPIAIGALVVLIAIGGYLGYVIYQSKQIEIIEMPAVIAEPSDLSDTSETSEISDESKSTTETADSSAFTAETTERPICDSSDINPDYIDPATLPGFPSLEKTKNQETNPDALGWMKYTDATYNYSYKVPFCWDKDLGTGYFKVRHPEDSTIYIEVASAATLASGMEGATKISDKKITYNKIPWQISYWKNNNDNKLTVIAGYFDTKIEYRVSIWNYPETRKVEIDNIFDQILATFKFTE